MPEVLRKFLQELPDIEYERVWLFLHNNPMAVQKMLIVLEAAHKDLKDES